MRRPAINAAVPGKPTTVLGIACSYGESPVQQAVLRLLLEAGGDPNEPNGNPVVVYPLTSTHSVGTIRQLIVHGACMDHAAVRMWRSFGHPDESRQGKELRRFLAEVADASDDAVAEH